MSLMGIYTLCICLFALGIFKATVLARKWKVLVPKICITFAFSQCLIVGDDWLVVSSPVLEIE